MSETALYRKYRPQKFKEVLGQDHIVKVLESSIEQGSISHAYIFSGTRGTGKTSVARIFAREIGTTSNDIYEIDAASNNGVDEVRALNESVNTLPLESKYKVYIFDEVHMFSKGAWNAFLKTLEEPPKHAIFILATTELNKVPETVISRCQTFVFKKPSHKILKEVALSVAKKEGFTLESSSADLIALLGDGSFRDTQGILQKIIGSSKDKNISVEEVVLVTGAPKTEIVNDYIRAIDKADVKLGLDAVSKAADSNIDMSLYFKLILHKMRAILLVRNFGGDSRIVDQMTDTDNSFINEIASRKDSKVNSQALETMLSYSEMITKSFIPELPLELALVKIIS